MLLYIFFTFSFIIVVAAYINIVFKFDFSASVGFVHYTVLFERASLVVLDILDA